MEAIARLSCRKGWEFALFPAWGVITGTGDILVMERQCTGKGEGVTYDCSCSCAKLAGGGRYKCEGMQSILHLTLIILIDSIGLNEPQGTYVLLYENVSLTVFVISDRLQRGSTIPEGADASWPSESC